MKAGKYTISARIVNLYSGEIKQQFSVSGTSAEELQEEVPELAKVLCMSNEEKREYVGIRENYFDHLEKGQSCVKAKVWEDAIGHFRQALTMRNTSKARNLLAEAQREKTRADELARKREEERRAAELAAARERERIKREEARHQQQIAEAQEKQRQEAERQRALEAAALREADARDNRCVIRMISNADSIADDVGNMVFTLGGGDLRRFVVDGQAVSQWFAAALSKNVTHSVQPGTHTVTLEQKSKYALGILGEGKIKSFDKKVNVGEGENVTVEF